MNITVYLPDELGRKAKDAGINLSAALRNAVQREIKKMEELAKHEDEMTEISVEIQDGDGEYFGTFTGKALASAGEITVYLDDNDRILVYDEADHTLKTYEDIDDPTLEESLSSLLRDRRDFLELTNMLGIKPTIEI